MKRKQEATEPGDGGHGIESTTSKVEPRPGPPGRPIAVAGICSSAGGLGALNRFFDAAPARSDVAYVVVPHLDPTHESMMVELLSRHTSMPVLQASEGAAVEADHVYVIPPNKRLLIEGGTLRLSTPAAPRHLRTAIDDFLRALARDQTSRAIGIVLSGTGSHGTLGVREIKAAGGMVMAQDPESAEYDSMPSAAIATGLVDFVLRPEEMPNTLGDYVRHPYVREETEAEASKREEEDLNRILSIVRARTKHDFRCYRKNMLLRRVRRRMGVCHVHDLGAYQAKLREDPAEATALYKDLLIGVTAFFREPEAFHVLEQRVLPGIVQKSDEDRPVRVWVPACATGEEAYSIGMLVIDAFVAAKRTPNLQLFATDLDEEALETARQGVYPDGAVADVSEERVRRYFTRYGEKGFQVKKQLRDCIVFAQQSLIGDAPFSRVDLVSCRNLLIYLEPELQTKVIGLFHFALREGGYLLLGPSESVGRQTNLFEVVSKKWRVYKRIGPTRHDLVDIPIRGATSPRLTGLRRLDGEGFGPTATGQRLAELAHRSLLADYAPAAVLVDRRCEILYFHGPTVDYLEFPSGQPSSNLLSIARPGLRTRIRAALRAAADTQEVFVDSEARVKRDGSYVNCRITAKPVRDTAVGEPLYLLSFEDQASPGEAPTAEVPATTAEARAAETRVVEQLENELKATREDLQSTIEELESSNEELKASNEEVMSMNEELQSANEELETSKEELQSINEELSTVNTELQGKVHDLEEVNNDVTNLLSSTDVATLFLDREMRIRLFTPQIARLLSLIESDVGRPITDFSAKVANAGLTEDAQRVLDELVPLEKELWSGGSDERCYLRRIVPYRTASNRIEGVVVTFVDITARVAVEARLEARVAARTKELRASRRRMQSIVDTAVDAIVMIDGRGTLELFNPAAERMFGYGASEVLGQNVNVLMPAPVRDEHDGYLEAYSRTGQAKVVGGGREVVGQRKDGSAFPIDLAVSRIEEDGAPKFVGTMRDITAVKRAQEELAREHALSEGIVSTARAVILRLDEQARIVSFNPYMTELTGYELAEVAGADWLETFVPERERERIRNRFESAMRGKGSHGNINAIRTKDGGEVLVEWYDDVLEVPGEPPSLIAIGHDVTDRDRLEREFLQAQKMEAVGRLAGGVAHDFNNLLAGILGGLRIAAEALDVAQPARKMIVQVQEEVERGVSITRRLLDFSRVGKTRPTPIDPRETLTAGERMMRRLLGEDIDVRLVCDSSVSRIHSDAGQLEQAILNLAINARDAMPDGGRLDIRCADVELSREEMERLDLGLEPGPYVVISVEDQGCGMDEATRSRALEAFFTTKDPGRGTGLGLSSVASMVRQSGGELLLESQVGEGTRVRMFFPRSSEAEAGASGTGEPAQESHEVPRGRGETILLVEDELLVRLGVQHVLQELGYEVLAFSDPRAALEELTTKQRKADLLLTDVLLPGMSGPDLARESTVVSPGMRVLYMSAFPTEELIDQGRVPRGTSTLEKPFTDEQVARKIRATLDADEASPGP